MFYKINIKQKNLSAEVIKVYHDFSFLSRFLNNLLEKKHTLCYNVN